MTGLRRRRREDLPRRGLAPKTHPCDSAAGKPLAHHDQRAPDHGSEAELRHYVVALRNDPQVAERAFRLHREGRRFVDERTLKRPGPVFDRIRPRKRHTRPGVLSPQEVRAGRLGQPPARRGMTKAWTATGVGSQVVGSSGNPAGRGKGAPIAEPLARGTPLSHGG